MNSPMNFSQNQEVPPLSGSLPLLSPLLPDLKTAFPILNSWIESLSPAPIAEKVRNHIIDLSTLVHTAGEKPTDLLRQLETLVGYGLTPSAVLAIQKVFAEAAHRQAPLVNTLSPLASYLPQTADVPAVQIDWRTMNLLKSGIFDADPDALSGKLNLITNLLFKETSPRFIEALTEVLALPLNKEEASRLFTTWMPAIRGYADIISSSSREVQEGNAAILKKVAADRGSTAYAIHNLKRLMSELSQAEQASYPNKVALLSVLSKTATTGRGILPGATPLIAWTIEMLDVLSNREANRTGSSRITWKVKELMTVTDQLALLANIAAHEKFALETLPADIFAQTTKVGLYAHIQLAQALTPKTSQCTHTQLLEEPARAIMFHTATRLSSFPNADAQVSALIEYAKTATRHHPKIEDVREFCNSQEFEAISSLYPKLMNPIKEYVATHPDAQKELHSEAIELLLNEGDHPRRSISNAAQAGIEALISYDMSLGRSPVESIRSLKTFSDRIPHDEPWSQLVGAIERFKEHGITLSGITSHFIINTSLFGEGEWTLVLKLLGAAQRSTKEQKLSSKDEQGVMNAVFKASVDFARMHASPRAFRAVERILRQELAPDDAIKLINREAKVYAAVLKRLELAASSTALSEQQKTIEFLVDFERMVIHNDGFPVRDKNRNETETAIAQRIQRETLNTFDLSYDIYHGFGAQRFTCQRVLEETPLTLRCVEECGASVTLLRERDEDLYPGTGFQITNIDAERIFQSQTLSRNDSKLSRDIFPYLKEHVGMISETTLIFMRGFIAVIPPERAQFTIDAWHYSYVVFNEHFGKYHLNPSILVPTEVLRSALHDHELYPTDTSSPLELDKLRKRAQTLHAGSILDLCSGSNLSTGLQNSFPPKSVPHFNWERTLERSSQDTFGHIHKYYLLNDKSAQFVSNYMETLQHLHTSVRTASLDCHRLLQTFQVIQAGWNRGYGGAQDDAMEHESLSYATLLDAALPTEWSSLITSPRMRMLQSAIQYYRAGQEGWDEGSIPVLAVSDAERYAQPPHQKVLDPLTLTLTTGNSQINLTELDAEDLATAWDSVTGTIASVEKSRRRFQDLRWVQRAYFDKE